MSRFAGKNVLVTGAGSGIGRGSALAFASQGARVACLGSTAHRLEETANQIASQGGYAITVPVDLRDGAQVSEAVAEVIARLKGLDIAHNNAAVFPPSSPVGEYDLERWNDTFAINVTGVLSCMQHQIAYMAANGGGSIVNASSNIGRHGRRPGLAAYAASKAAVSTLTAVAALDHIKDGVRINAVSPGATATSMSFRPDETHEDRAERLGRSVPIGRIGQIDEICQTVLWLASSEASYVVGQDVVVDGGVTA